eukprot:jgi/Hompol1/493/HPOL_003919-RA
MNSERKIAAANAIKRCWRGFHQRKVFKQLKYNIFHAVVRLMRTEQERTMTAEVLKRLSPNEAKLLSDSVIQTRVRFRFGGSAFPPKIMYKIYTKGMGVHYISGYKMIQPGSKAAEDSCAVMGNRAFQERIFFDEQQYLAFKISQPFEVTDRMEFIQYMNSLDCKAPHLGGRNNGWRELIIGQLAHQTVLYDMRRGNRPHRWDRGTAVQFSSMK